MNCNALVYYRQAPKRRHKIVISQYFVDETTLPEDAIDVYRCDGEIIATVIVTEGPYFGGSSTVLQIDYKCSKCGNECFPGLPSREYDLGEFLNKVIKQLPNEGGQ